MSLRHIDIIHTEPSDPEHPRTSHFTVDSKEPWQLWTSGNIPHGYCWRPKTVRDRDQFVTWLNSLEYDQ